MFCEKCGHILDGTSAFCEKCGTRVTLTASAQPVIQKSVEQNSKVVADEKVVCAKCGALNPTGFDICMQCGQVLGTIEKPITSQVKKTSSQKPKKPAAKKVKTPRGTKNYRKFGGLLLAIVCAGILLSVAGIFFTVLDLKDLWSSFHKLSKWMTGMEKTTVIAALTTDGLLILIYLLMIFTHVRFILKKPKVFWSFHRLILCLLVLIGMAAWFSRDWIHALIQILVVVTVCIIWTIYFIKSVRVRTYMGNDAYLRANPFTKNVASPKPQN